MYIQFCLYGLYFLVGRMAGVFTSAYDFAFQFAADPSAVYLIGRTSTALFGTAAVYLTYRIALRAFSVRVGYIAGFFCTLSFLYVQDAHFITTDIPMSFFVMLCTLFTLDLYTTGSRRALVLAALTAGLAASVKYNGGLVALPVLVAAMMKSPNRLKALGLAVPIIAAGFIGGSPYVLADFSGFWKGLSFELSHVGFGHLGFGDPVNGWWFHIRVSLAAGLGWTIVLLGLPALAIMLANPRRPPWILTLFPLVTFCLIGASSTLFQRYAIPLVPFVALFAAWAVVSIVNALGAAEKRRRNLLILVTLFCLSPLVPRVIWHNVLLTRPDTRTEARTWLESHLEPEAAVVVDAYGPQLITTDTRALGTSSGRSTKEQIKRELLRTRNAYHVINLSHQGSYDPDWVSARQPAWIVVSSYVADRIEAQASKFSEPHRFLTWLKKEVPLKKKFSPYRNTNAHPRPFDMKSLMSPALFDLYQRKQPGPILWIYGPIPPGTEF